MKRIVVASLLTAAALFGGLGCTEDMSGGEVDEPPPQVSPAPTPSEEATQPAGEEGQEASTGDALQSVDLSAPATEEEPEPLTGEILPQSDDRALEREDLADLDNWELTLARNEIFARHGRPFANEHIREHFEALGWYSPDPDYESAWLSAVEERNAEFILEHQKLTYDIPARHP